MIRLTPLGKRLLIAVVVLTIAALAVAVFGDMSGEVVRAPLSSI